ncbi:FxSxx-COOH system tetratricopeptide repeat protein [Actinocorallia longicatena]|uniref:DUF7779 domain-containing protein n=1 Tax=Actinocorallia longicatena TaxID=111803 RepID=A0ABP6QIW5_9ACTN
MSISHPAGSGRPAGRVPDIWGRVPPRNKNFTGREELLQRLRGGITRITAVVPHALQGFGGVGKTQMAVEYAHRYQHEYNIVWWVPADQPALVRATLAALAPYLGLPPVTATGIEDGANAVLDALRRGEPFDRWLLIFDNADEPQGLTDIIPQGPGHVLITSRNHKWEGVVDTVAVDVFTRDESLDFLAKRMPRSLGDPDTDRLAEELGDLPLALEQAGALQAETGMAVSEYLTLLTQRKTAELMEQGKPTEYPVSMTAAWGLSVASLNQSMPECIDLLRCCAFFGPEPIPRDVFNRPSAGLGQKMTSLLSEPIRLSRAFGELGRYALAKIDPQTRTVQVHRLIQALVREELTEAERDALRHEVHLLLAQHAPSEPDEKNNWPKFNGLLGHVQSAGVALSDDREVRKFALSFVRYLFASGDYVTAQAFAELLDETWLSVDGIESMDVLEARRHLGNVRRALGGYAAAFELNQDTLQKVEALAGPTSDSALSLINGAGADLRARGDFRAALAREQESVDRHREKYGNSHFLTLRAVNNLALDYGLASDYPECRKLHEESYLGSVALESGAINRLAAWSGIARAVRLCGDYSEACDVGEEAYAFGREELDPEHPWTLLSAKDLSIAWRRVGDSDRSLELAQDVHARYVRQYGLNYPDTLAAAICLSNIQRTVGEFDAAKELIVDTVNRYASVYGEQHPYYHGCLGNLALLHRTMDDPERARTLNERALAGLDEALGRDHHYTLTVAANLASDLAALGHLEEARVLGTDTLERLTQVLGARHPMTLACAANLSADLETLDLKEEARTLYEATIAHYSATLGLSHPDAVVAQERRHLDSDFDPPPI